MGAAGCHDTADVIVASLRLTGVHALPASQLKHVLATQASGWLPWSKKRAFDRSAFEADLARIHAYYADHGYPHERIQDVHVDLNTHHTAVAITIAIDEGPPVVVQAVHLQGFDGLPDEAKRKLAQAPLHAGQPLDRDAVSTTRSLGARLFRDYGCPLAQVNTSEQTVGTDRVEVTIDATPGPQMQFGAVTFSGLHQVSENVLRRMLQFAPGDQYREGKVLAAQRRISSLELFQVATVSPELDAVAHNQVPVRVTVVEGPSRRLDFGVGYGTDDRARGTVHWEHLNFFGGTRQATVDGRVSFITESARVGLLQPYLGRPDLSMAISGVAERIRQLTYDSETYGGSLRFTWQDERGGGRVSGQTVRYEAHVEYTHDYLSYGIRKEDLNDLSQRDERIALGLDPETGRGAGTLASLSLDVQRTALDNPAAPREGSMVSLHLEHAAPWLAGTYRYDEFRMDAYRFQPVGALDLVGRVQYGTVFGSDPAKIPFSKRYFLGGATTLRGWGRFQVSPLDSAGLPIGGRSLVQTSLDVVFPIHGKFGGTLFVDAGNVWSSGWTAAAKQLRVDAGPGLRYDTPVGTVSVDLGIQLTPIPGLIIDGQPEHRRWRIQLNFGRPF